DWLERLLVPIGRGADVAAGGYRPLPGAFFQTCAGAVSVRDPEEIGPGWMPSSRSIAFRREVFDAAGPYPEWLAVGEDMYLDHAFVRIGARIEVAPDAVVFWRIRPTLSETWRQYARYAEGDALGSMYPRRHLLRYLVYGAAALAAGRRRRALLVPMALGGLAYAARPVRRVWTRLPRGTWERAAGAAVVPAL